MQDRRYRPGDVLDDYCPRERRITDHAIVAMIDDEIRRTRCGSCDAEHEYKEAKVPSTRRKTQPPALFKQVLEGMDGTIPKPHPVDAPTDIIESPVAAAATNVDDVAPALTVAPEASQAPLVPNTVEPQEPQEPHDPQEPQDPQEPAEGDGEREGGFRRSLIRATFPRPDGQPPSTVRSPRSPVNRGTTRPNASGP